jgi:flagellar biosynthesis/type III secretory pathway M-ring protein FliF/YscJ
VINQALATLRALPARSQAAALPAGAEPAKRPTTVAEIESELQRELSETNSEVMRSIVLKKHLVEKVKKEPESASRLIQGWVKQSPQGT